MDKLRLINEIEKEKLIVILRGIPEEKLFLVVKALYTGGVRFCEVTFDAKGDIPDAVIAERIGSLVKEFSGRVHVGAGTVLKKEQVELVASVGGEFIISPDVNTEVIQKTVERGLVSIPGAFTPTETVTAHNVGADFVKLFPVGEMKPSYLSALAAPLSHIKFLAVGGVNLSDIADFKKAGAVGFGVSSGIADKNLIEKCDWEGLTALAAKYVTAVKKG